MNSQTLNVYFTIHAYIEGKYCELDTYLLQLYPIDADVYIYDSFVKKLNEICWSKYPYNECVVRKLYENKINKHDKLLSDVSFRWHTSKELFCRKWKDLSEQDFKEIKNKSVTDITLI